MSDRYYDVDAETYVTVEHFLDLVSIWWDDPAAAARDSPFDGVDEAVMFERDFEKQIGERFVESNESD